MDLLEYFVEHHHVDADQQKMPIRIPEIGRYALGYIFRDLGYRTGAEIGVESGHFSEWLCKRIPGLHLYCIDPWMAFSDYRTRVSQEQADSFYKTTQKRLTQFNCTLIKNFSVNAAKDFKDGSLDFFFLDGNHDFQNTANDLCEWTKKVRSGGIIAGHDYTHEEESGPDENKVSFVVDAFTLAYNIKPWFVLGHSKGVNKHGRERVQMQTFLWMKK